MDIPFSLPGLEHIKLSLRPATIFKGAKIIYNGEVLPHKKGKYVLSRNNEPDIELSLKPGLDFILPKVAYNEHIIEVAPALPSYQYVWSLLPLVLMFFGGAIGGACGGLASYLNLSVFRSKLNIIAKFGISFLIGVAAFGLWILVASFINSMIGSK